MLISMGPDLGPLGDSASCFAASVTAQSKVATSLEPPSEYLQKNKQWSILLMTSLSSASFHISAGIRARLTKMNNKNSIVAGVIDQDHLDTPIDAPKAIKECDICTVDCL